MRCAIYSNAQSATDGGGVTFITAIGAALAEEHDVDLFFDIAMDAGRLREILPDFGRWPAIRRTPARSKRRVVGEIGKTLRDLAYDVVVVQSSHVPGLNAVRRGYLLCEFPFADELALDDRIRLRTYPQVVANSRYTARWIERRWGRRADVLYPPVRLVAAGTKQRYILAVGRFTGGGRSKRQRDMTAMFRTLCEGGLTGWELHLAGFVQDRAYADAVQEEARGLPVHFHFDVSRAELEALYAASSLFWHAVGAGVDPEREPARMEHFGITTVEAMSAGCVPVVIDRGGQSEIVAPSGAGVLWEDFEDCIAATRALTQDASRRDALARRAEERARDFALPTFNERVRRTFEV